MALGYGGMPFSKHGLPMRLKITVQRPALFLRAILLVISVCVLFVGMDVERAISSREIRLAQTRTETDNLSRSLAQYTHQILLQAQLALQGLRERLEYEGPQAAISPRLQDWMGQQVRAIPAIEHLIIFDRHGQALIGSIDIEQLSLNISKTDYFQHFQNTPDRSVHIGEPMQCRIDGTWVVTLSIRVDDEQGQFAGLVMATIPVDFFQKFFETFDVGDHGIIALTHNTGDVIARRPADPQLIGINLSDSTLFRQYLPHNIAGSFEYISAIDGVHRLGSYRQIEDYPLVILVSRAWDEVLGDWYREATLHLSVSALLSVLVAVAAALILRQAYRMHRVEARFRVLTDSSGDALTCVALDGTRLYAGPAFTRLTGWSVDECIGRQVSELVHPDDLALVRETQQRCRDKQLDTVCSYRCLCKDGSYRWVEARFTLTEDLEPAPQIIANLRDITGRKELELQLEEANRELAVLASTDTLTGLANRRRLNEMLQLEWRRAVRHKTPLSLVMIDIDHFKAFNDQYGHQAGDICLTRLSAVVRGAAKRPGDLAARFGGEELLLLLPETDISGAQKVAEQVRQTIMALGMPNPGNLAGDGWVTASLGVSCVRPTTGEVVEDGIAALIRCADNALYQAKSEGRNCVKVSTVEVPVI